MSKLNDLTPITTPALTDLAYCVQNSTDYKVTNAQLLGLIKDNTELSDLSDVDVDSQTLADGQVPVYNSTTQKWENGDISVPSELSDLSDVSTSSPSNGDVLSYNGSSWVNSGITTASDWVWSEITNIATGWSGRGYSYVLKNPKLRLAYVHIYVVATANKSAGDLVVTLDFNPAMTLAHIATVSSASTTASITINTNGTVNVGAYSSPIQSGYQIEFNTIVPY